MKNQFNIVDDKEANQHNYQFCLQQGNNQVDSLSKQHCCSICQRLYSSKQSLSNHMRIKHSDLSQSNAYYDSAPLNENNYQRPNINFLKLINYEDYKYFISSQTTICNSRLGLGISQDHMFNQIVEDTFREVYLSFVKKFKSTRWKKDESPDWSSCYEHILRKDVISNSNNFSILSYIGFAYYYAISCDSICFLRSLKLKVNGFNEMLQKIISSYSIDDVLQAYIKFHTKRFNQHFLLFMLKVVCLLREFINLRQYLHYNKHKYTEKFSPDVIPKFSFEFFIHLLDDNETSLVKSQFRSQIFASQEDNNDLDSILRFEKKEKIFFIKPPNSSLENKTELVLNFDLFMNVVKPRLKKGERKSPHHIISAAPKDVKEEVADPINKNEENDSPFIQLRKELSSSGSFRIRHIREIFFVLDHLCLWLNKYNYCLERFMQESD